MKAELSYKELIDLYQTKSQSLLKLFASLHDSQEIYQKIIALGQTLPPFPEHFKVEKNLVQGCQSEVYLVSELSADGKIFFHIHSEALISSGLAALLLAIYSDEPVGLIVLCPPRFIEELGLSKSLSPRRSNGLASIYSRMKKEATELYIQKQNKQ